MDTTAIAQCMEHDLPILVFNYRKDGNIERAVPAKRSARWSAARVTAKKVMKGAVSKCRGLSRRHTEITTHAPHFLTSSIDYGETHEY